VSDVQSSYGELAAARGFEQLPAADPGPLTPLLVEAKGAPLQPALRGELGEGVAGVVGHLAYKRNKTFRFNVALTEVPAATAFAPRVFCIRRGRSTRDDEFYGFEARHSKLWTESTALNERYAVSTSPYQDPIWLRQLFSPSFVDWLGTAPPADFSFELAYGAVLGSIEVDDPGADGLAALCEATARVAIRIREECEE
jgi:hypothetical protein